MSDDGTSSGGLDPKAMNIILGIAGALVFIYIIALIISVATRKTKYKWLGKVNVLIIGQQVETVMEI